MGWYYYKKGVIETQRHGPQREDCADRYRERQPWTSQGERSGTDLALIALTRNLSGEVLDFEM